MSFTTEVNDRGGTRGTSEVAGISLYYFLYDDFIIEILIKAEAAEKRSKDFKQGGGGEKLKAKAKQLEEAERKNREAGGPNSLKWSVS